MFLAPGWPLPPSTPCLGECRIEYQLAGVRLEVDSADAADVRFEDCDPVRHFPSWPRKRHYSGLMYMETMRRHVAFESLAERSFLIELDRTPGVSAVSSQPMWIRWSGDPRRQHAPDYFVRCDDGTGTVVDVRPLGRIDFSAREQFDRTALLCRDLGWNYVVHSQDSRTRDANLRFLLRYRGPRWELGDAATKLDGFDGTLRGAAALLGPESDGLGRCYALIWSGQLLADLDEPLTMQTPLRWRDDG